MLLATSEDDLKTIPYSKKIQNEHIKHKNHINGSVWEPHPRSKNCHKW